MNRQGGLRTRSCHLKLGYTTLVVILGEYFVSNHHKLETPYIWIMVHYDNITRGFNILLQSQLLLCMYSSTESPCITGIQYTLLFYVQRENYSLDCLLINHPRHCQSCCMFIKHRSLLENIKHRSTQKKLWTFMFSDV
jgi:hypothetical protein